MSEIILYPTETIYGLGVNVLDDQALDALFALKGRDESKAVSWLVRSAEDIARYAHIPLSAEELIDTFLPGPLTLILQVRDGVPSRCVAKDGTVGFRISSDPVAQGLIFEYMTAHDAPLTCTSANVSGCAPKETVEAICAQFGDRRDMITRVIDDGPRSGTASTVVRCVEDAVSVLREGSISAIEINEALS